MKLDDLVGRLQAQQRAGFGDRRVVDQLGNDVAEVVSPLSGDWEADSDAGSVLLNCWIERPSTALLALTNLPEDLT